VHHPRVKKDGPFPSVWIGGLNDLVLDVLVLHASGNLAAGSN
jgi:hypothetical protein